MEVLQRFERDLDALKTAELHPAARAGRATHLLDLLPEVKLKDWHANCTHAHSQFADKARHAPRHGSVIYKRFK